MRRFRAMSVAERTDIGARCRRHVEDRFGLPVMHAAYERIYDDVCSKTAPDGGAAIENGGASAVTDPSQARHDRSG